MIVFISNYPYSCFLNSSVSCFVTTENALTIFQSKMMSPNVLFYLFNRVKTQTYSMYDDIKQRKYTAETENTLIGSVRHVE